jgi:hypothetical protein
VDIETSVSTRLGIPGMPPDPQRIAAEAANHVTIGLLQGAGFALAGIIVGLVVSVVLHHPTGFLVGCALFAVLFVRAKKARVGTEGR